MVEEYGHAAQGAPPRPGISAVDIHAGLVGLCTGSHEDALPSGRVSPGRSVSDAKKIGRFGLLSPYRPAFPAPRKARKPRQRGLDFPRTYFFSTVFSRVSLPLAARGKSP